MLLLKKLHSIIYCGNILSAINNIYCNPPNTSTILRGGAFIDVLSLNKVNPFSLCFWISKLLQLLDLAWMKPNLLISIWYFHAIPIIPRHRLNQLTSTKEKRREEIVDGWNNWVTFWVYKSFLMTLGISWQKLVNLNHLIVWFKLPITASNIKKTLAGYIYPTYLHHAHVYFNLHTFYFTVLCLPTFSYVHFKCIKNRAMWGSIIITAFALYC